MRNKSIIGIGVALSLVVTSIPLSKPAEAVNTLYDTTTPSITKDTANGVYSVDAIRQQQIAESKTKLAKRKNKKLSKLTEETVVELDGTQNLDDLLVGDEYICKVVNKDTEMYKKSNNEISVAYRDEFDGENDLGKLGTLLTYSGTMAVYKVTDANIDKAIEKLSKTKGIEIIEPNYEVSLFATEPTDWDLNDVGVYRDVPTGGVYDFTSNMTYDLYKMREQFHLELSSPYKEPLNTKSSARFMGAFLLNSHLCHDIDIDAYGAWSKYYDPDGQEVIVAVIDTPVNIQHRDLKNELWVNEDEIPDNGIDDDNNGYIDDVNGWNFGDNNNILYPTDEYINGKLNDMNMLHHGSNVAGIIAASDDDMGAIGVASNVNVKIMTLPVIRADGTGGASCIMQALEYANANGAVIANISCGSDVDFTDANDDYKANISNISALYNKVINNINMLCVAAAGNEHNEVSGDKAACIPATLDCHNIISVNSITIEGMLSSFSNYSASTVDISAIECATSTGATDEEYYCYMGGTSQSAPMVSGSAAIAYAMAWDYLTPPRPAEDGSGDTWYDAPLEIKSLILNSASTESHMRPYLQSGPIDSGEVCYITDKEDPLYGWADTIKEYDGEMWGLINAGPVSVTNGVLNVSNMVDLTFKFIEAAQSEDGSVENPIVIPTRTPSPYTPTPVPTTPPTPYPTLDIPYLPSYTVPPTEAPTYSTNTPKPTSTKKPTSLPDNDDEDDDEDEEDDEHIPFISWSTTTSTTSTYKKKLNVDIYSSDGIIKEVKLAEGRKSKDEMESLTDCETITVGEKEIIVRFDITKSGIYTLYTTDGITSKTKVIQINLKELKFNISKATLKKGKSKTYKATYKYGGSGLITYKSSNKKIATVNKKTGKVKAKKKGTVTITAKASKAKSAKYKLKVK